MRKFFNSLFFGKAILKQVEQNLWGLNEHVKRLNSTYTVELRRERSGLQHSSNALIDLFQTLAPFFDHESVELWIKNLKSINVRNKFGVVIANLDVIKEHIKNCGRDEHGMNRTVKGEEVTAQHVYLGAVEGRHTLSLKTWLGHQEEDEAIIRQAKNFFLSHVPVLMNLTQETYTVGKFAKYSSK